MAPSLSKPGSDDIVEAVDACTTTSPFSVKGPNLLANGSVVLADVPDNVAITLSPYEGGNGCFLGFQADEARSRHVVPIGKLKGIRFMSIFRFKVWWTTHWVGSSGRDVESETQMMILENSETENRPYVLILPLLEGPFRASLEAHSPETDFVSVCVESGSTKLRSAAFKSVVYLHAGEDPFDLVKEAFEAVRVHMGTFKLLREKTPPEIVNRFGWCTWDAFYLTVHPRGVIDGVRGLTEGGCPPGMVLVDDGWQRVARDADASAEEDVSQVVAGDQMPCRLVDFRENRKFRDYVSTRRVGDTGMGAFVKDLKEEFPSVDHVYVWHALCGYWGGVRPGRQGLPETRVVRPELSPGLRATMEDLAVDKIVSTGVGLVAPEKAAEMFEGLHAHLESVGIDGVKVDVIHILEMLCEDYGGRVELAQEYYKALTASVNKHFKGNGVIASMEHCNDFMFLGTQAISLGRVGDDFWCTDPSGDPNGTFWLQGCHMVHCAYNSLWMGNFIQPDWDMFQSTHPCAAFHAASRAISGGPIYVSDSVGQHDFDLLKTLVLPDGTILRCSYYALPTRDCLFDDPLHDGKTMLKIWNLNKYTGVLGAFNCQGGGWSRETRRNQCASEHSKSVSSKLCPNDIEWTSGSDPIPVAGVNLFAMYFAQSKKLVLSEPSDKVDISLDPFHFELVTVSPVKELPGKPVQFAPIGLVNMLNNGGAIQSLDLDRETSSVRVGVRGSGEMRIFASKKPEACRVNGREAGFEYAESMVVVEVAWPGCSDLSIVEYIF